MAAITPKLRKWRLTTPLFVLKVRRAHFLQRWSAISDLDTGDKLSQIAIDHV